jgi:REP element-mobilizing transposase RayT
MGHSDMLAFHLVTTTYGTWLPGDPRGHWSPILNADEKLVYHSGVPQSGDPMTEEWARKQMKHDMVVLTPEHRKTMADSIGQTTKRYGYRVIAAAIWSTHIHLVIEKTKEDISAVAGRYKGISGKDVRAVRGPGPIWTAGYFKVFLFKEQHVQAAVHYVEEHNRVLGLPLRPWDWITDWCS